MENLNENLYENFSEPNKMKENEIISHLENEDQINLGDGGVEIKKNDNEINFDNSNLKNEIISKQDNNEDNNVLVLKEDSYHEQEFREEFQEENNIISKETNLQEHFESNLEQTTANDDNLEKANKIIENENLFENNNLNGQDQKNETIENNTIENLNNEVLPIVSHEKEFHSQGEKQIVSAENMEEIKQNFENQEIIKNTHQSEENEDDNELKVQNDDNKESIEEKPKSCNKLKEDKKNENVGQENHSFPQENENKEISDKEFDDFKGPEQEIDIPNSHNLDIKEAENEIQENKIENEIQKNNSMEKQNHQEVEEDDEFDEFTGQEYINSDINQPSNPNSNVENQKENNEHKENGANDLFDEFKMSDQNAQKLEETIQQQEEIKNNTEINNAPNIQQEETNSKENKGDEEDEDFGEFNEVEINKENNENQINNEAANASAMEKTKEEQNLKPSEDLFQNPNNAPETGTFSFSNNFSNNFSNFGNFQNSLPNSFSNNFSSFNFFDMKAKNDKNENETIENNEKNIETDLKELRKNNDIDDLFGEEENKPEENSPEKNEIKSPIFEEDQDTSEKKNNFTESPSKNERKDYVND